MAASPYVGTSTPDQALFLALIFTVHVLLVLFGCYTHSPVGDEPAHIAAGISHWELGRFDLYRVNPPLSRCVATLPAYCSGTRTSWDKYSAAPGARAEFEVGTDIMILNRHRLRLLLFACRATGLVFSLSGGLACYLWASSIYGISGGRIAVLLWSFCPNVIAHSQHVGPDVAAASAAVWAMYALRAWLLQPTVAHILYASLAMSVAQLTKTSNLILVPIAIAVCIIWRIYDCLFYGVLNYRRDAWHMVLFSMLILYMINAAYAFDGTFTQLGKYQFVSTALGGRVERDYTVPGNRFTHSTIGIVRIPLPMPYVLGIDEQKWEFDQEKWCYLRGEWRRGGWWYYYLYAALIKVPIGTLCLIGLTCCNVFRHLWGVFVSRQRDHKSAQPGCSSSLANEMLLLLCIGAVLFTASANTGINRHFRYVLPALPFGFILAGKCARYVTAGSVMAPVVLVCVTWAVASSLSIYPHSLSYFNELVGGPANGHEHLAGDGADSNIDWGQDLYGLQQWIDDHPRARPLRVALSAYSDEAISLAGIDAPAARPDICCDAIGEDGGVVTSGWYAISISRLHARHRGYECFLRLTPVAMIGYSIYVYHVE